MKHRLAQWLRARADKLDPPPSFQVTYINPVYSPDDFWPKSGSGNGVTWSVKP